MRQILHWRHETPRCLDFHLGPLHKHIAATHITPHRTLIAHIQFLLVQDARIIKTYHSKLLNISKPFTFQNVAKEGKFYTCSVDGL
jgi:hypothetical protein